MKYGLVIILFLISAAAYPGMYETRDPEGNFIYSDTPIDTTTQKVNLPPLNTTEAIPVNKSSSANQANTAASPEPAVTKSQKKPYTLFSIKSPVDQSTIQNQPIITVEIDMEPELQEGDKIQIYLDEKPWGSPLTKNKIELANVERGTHRIYADLLENNEIVIKKSDTVTIFVHQAHLGGGL